MKPPRRSSAPEREMTKEDWKALYLTMRLSEEIVLHGAQALDTFIAAMQGVAASSDQKRSET